MDVGWTDEERRELYAVEWEESPGGFWDSLRGLSAGENPLGR